MEYQNGKMFPIMALNESATVYRKQAEALLNNIRTNIQAVIDETGFKEDLWAAAANFKEGTLRHFLTSRTHELGIGKVIALALAFGVTLDELQMEPLDFKRVLRGRGNPIALEGGLLAYRLANPDSFPYSELSKPRTKRTNQMVAGSSPAPGARELQEAA